MFTAWKNGPEDNSLEGRKKRISEGLNNLSPEEKDAAIGATDKAFGIRPDPGVPTRGTPRQRKDPGERALYQQVKKAVDDPANAPKPAGVLNRPLSLGTEGPTPLDIGNQRSYHDDMSDGMTSEMEETKAQMNPLMDRLQSLFQENNDVIDDKMGPVRKYLGELQEQINSSTEPKERAKLASMRSNFALQVAMAQTYSGQTRDGISRGLTYRDIQAMLPFIDKLKEDVGDESDETMQKFVQSRRRFDHPIEVATMFREAMAPELLEKLRSNSGKYGIGRQQFIDSKTGEITSHNTNNLHYGLDEEGNIKRGGQNTNSRIDALIKTALDQGFADPYTGLPLDWDFMELDHVVEATRKAEGQDYPEVNSWEYRDHPDNWLWTSTSTNNPKGAHGVRHLIENALSKKDLKESDFVSKDDQISNKDRIKSALVPLLQMMFPGFDADDYGKGGNARTIHELPESVTREMLDTYFDAEPKQFEAIREIEKKLNKAKSKLEPRDYKELARTLGLKTDQTKTQKADDEFDDETFNIGAKNQLFPNTLYYRPLINNLIGKDSKAKKGMIDGFNEASLRALRLMLSHSGSRKDLAAMAKLAGENNLVSLTPRKIQQTEKGELDMGGTYANYMLKEMHDRGLLDLKQMVDLDKGGRANSATNNLINNLARILGKKREDLLQ